MKKVDSINDRNLGIIDESDHLLVNILGYCQPIKTSGRPVANGPYKILQFSSFCVIVIKIGIDRKLL